MGRLVKPSARSLMKGAEMFSLPSSSGKRQIDFSLGNPAQVDPIAFSPPQYVQQELARMKDTHAYGESRGNPLLVARLSERLGVPTNHLVILHGASEGIQLLIESVLPGSILLPAPCFPPYILRHRNASKELVFYRTGLDGVPDINDMEEQIKSHRPSAILVLNPSNPTGAVYGEPTLRDILYIAKKHDLPVVSDEVYRELCFDDPPSRIRTLTTEVPIIELGTFSKIYLLCGDRVGWITVYNADDDTRELIYAVMAQASLRLCPNNPGQLAAIAALSQEPTEYLKTMVDTLRTRAKVMQDGLASISGVTFIEPKAGFCIWFGIDGLELSDIEFKNRLEQEEAVSITPGSAYGAMTDRGTRWFRAVFLPTEELIREGVERIKQFVERVRT
jgi:alanine-synthesizing transaminase